jgi:amino acid adenylation domain-containing protein
MELAVRRAQNRSATQEPFVTSLNEIRLEQLFAEQVARAPDRPAIDDGRIELSYRDLDERSDAVAAALLQAGARAGDLIGISVERSIRLPVLVLGCLKAGVAYVPLDASDPALRLAYMTEVARLQLVITEAGVRPGWVADSIRVLDASALCTGPARTGPLPRLASSAGLAYVIFTSGSTGTIKGVAMPHAPLVNLIRWQATQPGLGEAARTLQFTSLSFDVSFQELFTTWATGGCVVMIPDEIRRDPFELARYISEHFVERLFLPFVALAGLCHAFCQESPGPLVLRDVISAGEQLRVTSAIRDAFTSLGSVRLHNHYRHSETHVVSAHTLAGNPAAWPARPPIGRAVDNVELFVVDTSGNELTDAQLAAGEIGELHVAGAALAVGYVHRPDLTAQRFSSHAVHGRVYATGDLVRGTRADGFEYVGRSDRQVKVPGQRVELDEVETTLGVDEPDETEYAHLLAHTAGVAAATSRQGVGALIVQHALSARPARLNVVTRVDLPGIVDVPAVMDAVQDLVARHEVLRVRFVLGANEVCTEAVGEEPTVAIVDSQPDTHEQLVREHLVCESQRPLDIFSGAAARFTLVAQDRGVSTLVMTVHHAICDSLSIATLVRDLCGLYEGTITQTPPPMPSSLLAPVTLVEEGLRYWRRRLTGLDSVRLPIAGDPDAPGLLAREPVHIAPRTWALFEHALRAHSCGSFAGLLAAWGLVLTELTGSDRFAVASPVSVRDAWGAGDQVGHFLNTVVIAVDAAGRSRSDYLTVCSRLALEALDYSAVDFADVVAALRPRQFGELNPLAQTLLVVQPPAPEVTVFGAPARVEIDAVAGGSLDQRSPGARLCAGDLARLRRRARRPRHGHPLRPRSRGSDRCTEHLRRRGCDSGRAGETDVAWPASVFTSPGDICTAFNE